MATGAAFSQVLYARLLVPNLSQSHSVPTLVWLAVASPFG